MRCNLWTLGASCAHLAWIPSACRKVARRYRCSYGTEDCGERDGVASDEILVKVEMMEKNKID